jgi:hypothetical protein
MIKKGFIMRYFLTQGDKNKMRIKNYMGNGSKAGLREYFWDTYGPRTALGTVNSGQFSAQCGSARGSVFESVR